MNESKKYLVSVILGLTVGVGCSTLHTPAWDRPNDNQSESKESVSEFDLNGERASVEKAWKNLDQQSELEKAIQGTEKIVRNGKGEYQDFVRLSEGYAILSHYFKNKETQLRKFWNRGLVMGERALMTNEAFRNQVKNQGQNIDDALGTLTEKESAAMYWTAVNLVRWANAEGFITLTRNRPTALKLLDRLEQVNPNFRKGSLYQFRGDFFATSALFLGYDMADSEASFKKAVELGPNFGETWLRYAETYAYEKYDLDLYQELLKKALEVTDTSEPALQKLVKQRAQELMQESERAF